MNSELLVMRRELSAILCRNPDLRQAMIEVNKMNMIKASLVVRNDRHQNIQIDRIAEGELQKDISVGDYVFIQNFNELNKAAFNNLDMGNNMNLSLLVNAYRLLSENPDGGFRQDTPVIYSFNHVPPHHSEVEKRLSNSIRMVYNGAIENDVVARAMFMHNCIIDVWPFEEFNGEIAVFALNYYLLENGFMPIDMPIARQDYMELISSGLKGIKADKEYYFFENAIYSRMKETIETCRGF